MITQSKVRKVGNSLGSILPKEVIADLKVQEGSVLYFTEAPDGVRITSRRRDRLIMAAFDVIPWRGGPALGRTIQCQGLAQRR